MNVQMIQEVFDQDFQSINKRFTLLTNEYQSMKLEIGELKMNRFILAKHIYQNNIKDKTIKLILYPLILLIILFFLLIIFDVYIIPGLVDVMIIFNNNLQLITFFSYFVRFIIIVYVLIMICFWMLVYRIKKRPYSFYLQALNRGYFKLVVEHYSMQFASYYLILLKQGINTKQCFTLLSKIKDNKILLSITKQCIENFQQGEDMVFTINQLPFDKTLKKFLLTGYTTGTTQILLDEYINLADKRFFLQLGKWVKTLQFVIYVIIGIFVITLYRILLLPMESLTF